MPRKPMPWFRFYTETITDRKVRRIPPAQRWVWAAVMAAARESPVPGRLMVTEHLPMTLTELADYADIRERDVAAAVQLMERLLMLHWDDDVIVVTNFGKRQPESDNVNARVEKHRAKTVPSNDVETLQPRSEKQVGNEPEVEKEKEIDLSYVDLGGGSSVPRESHPQAHPQAEPSPNCPAHPTGTTDPCGPCGRAKAALADWRAEERRRQSIAASEAAKERARLVKAAVDRCTLCDHDGRRPVPDGLGPICDHIHRQPGALARARASAAQPESRTA